MAGELIARGIVDNDETWRLFAPYELVWAGGRLGRVLAQGLYWGSRPVTRIEEGLARYREHARARRAARIAARLKAEAHRAIAAHTLAGHEAEAAAEHAAVEQGAAHSEPPAPGFAHAEQPHVEFGHRQRPPQEPPG
jgi:gamma-glutamylputrescine oxidase